MLLASSLLPLAAGTAFAHTVSIGYESLGGGTFNFWYGTYHFPVEATYTEGSLNLTGPGFDETVPFSLLVATKPAGLIDGDTNFYSDGTQLGTTNAYAGSGPVQVWQGTQFTDLSQPGVYTFTYIPIAVPTQVWDPIDDVILSSQITITGGLIVTPADVGLPLPGPTAPQVAASAMTSFLTTMLDPYTGRRAPGCGPDHRYPLDDRLCRDERSFGSRLVSGVVKPHPAAEVNAAYLAPDDDMRRYSVWSTVYGGETRRTHDDIKATSDMVGAAAGLDYRLMPDWVAGFAAGGGTTSFGLSDGLGSGESDLFQVGAYTRYHSGPAYLAAALAYAWNDVSTDRTEVTGDRLVSDYGGHNYGGRLEAGYRIETPFFAVMPHAAAQVQWFRTPSHSEKAEGDDDDFFALSSQAKTSTFWRTELGAWFDRTLFPDPDTLVVLRSRIAWAHNGGSNQTLSAAYRGMPDTTFTINGIKPVSDSLLVSAGLDFRLGNWLMSAKFDGELADDYRSYAGTGVLRYTW